MNEIGRNYFPDEERVVVEWEAGPTETPIRFNLGGLSGELKPSTPTIVPQNVASVLAEGHNIRTSAVPDDYEPPVKAVDSDATHPGGAPNPDAARVLDGPGGVPATITPNDGSMQGDSINGGEEGQVTEGPILTGEGTGESGEGSETQQNASEADDADEAENAEDAELAQKAEALKSQSVAKIEQAISDGQDLDVLKAALAAEKDAGPDQERKGAVEALTKAIEQHPDNQTS